MKKLLYAMVRCLECRLNWVIADNETVPVCIVCRAILPGIAKKRQLQQGGKQ